MESLNDKLIYLLQKGLPLESHPFAAIGKQLELSEEEVIAKVKELQQSGLIRRFGGVFNSASLGFKSCLCAVDVPEKDIKRLNDMISPDSGVTHCYIRDSKPNLWFTFTAKSENYEDGLEVFRKKIAPYRLLVLPAIKKFKVQVIFDKTDSGRNDNAKVKKSDTINPTEKEKNLISYFQGNVPVKADYFNVEELEYSEKEIIELLTKWVKYGALKRVSAIIRHYKFGFKGNAMCVWKVPDAKVVQLGEKLAGLKEVSHCYQREMYSEFPYNLYAMVHAESDEKVQEKFREISEKYQLENGEMLLSTKELKKTSPIYFKPKMQFSVYIMTVIVFLLITGAFPLMGAEAVYKSAFMIILLGLLSFLSLICCSKQALSALIGLVRGDRYSLKLRKLGFYLSHIGVVVILYGALIGYIWGEKVEFGIYVGNKYVVSQLIDQRKPDVTADLDYSFFITDFKVEKFDPVFSLFIKDVNAPNGFTKVKNFNLVEDKIVLEDGLGEIPREQLKDQFGNWIPHYFVNEKYVLMTNKPGDKWYSAKFNIKDEGIEESFDFEVNNPVSYKKWRFYLMSYGSDRQGEYVVITARKDPGRIKVISGIWMLIIGIFMICLLRKK